MAKVLNAVFGIGIAVVVYILILLGIQAFYPEPMYENYCNQTQYAQPIGFDKCTDNMTMGECRKNSEIVDKQMQECQKNYDNAEKIYNRNFFIISSTLGLLTVIIAFFLLNLTNISAGVACSGIVLIMWAFMRGWRSTDNKLKFFIGLIIAIVVIVLAVIVNKRLSEKPKKKN